MNKFTQHSGWISLAAISAILFGIGDFFVVKSESSMDVVTTFAAYSIIVGILGAILIASRLNTKQVFQLDFNLLILISILHFAAYLAHFIAIQSATNPGYANALVMFHVVVLALLSYWFLNRELTLKGIGGILLMFIGAFIVTTL